MNEKSISVVPICFVMACCALAPESEPLPETREGFDSVVRTWIRDGDAVSSARTRLENKQFRCLDHAERGVTVCERSDGSAVSPVVIRKYTIVFTPANGEVTSIESNVGLVGL